MLGSHFSLVGQLQLFYVVREVQRNLNRLLKRIFRVIYIHVCFQLKTISNNLLAALGERTDEVLAWRSLVIHISPKRHGLTTLLRTNRMLCSVALTTFVSPIFLTKNL